MSHLRLLPVVTGESLPAGTVRPATRGDCVGGQRPCPWVGCRHHLYLEARKNGDLRSAFAIEPSDMVESCSLDVADAGTSDYRQAAKALGISHQLADLSFQAAARKLRKVLDVSMLDDFTHEEQGIDFEDDITDVASREFELQVEAAYFKLFGKHDWGNRLAPEKTES